MWKQQHKHIKRFFFLRYEWKVKQEDLDKYDAEFEKKKLKRKMKNY